MLALGFKQCKSDTGVYYFINKETRELVIAIIYVNDVCFMSSKDSLLLLELKQKFMMKWECYDLGETKEFLGIYISHNCKNWKIFVDQSEYLNKVLAQFNVTTNLTSTPLLLGYVFESNDKQCNLNFHQKYQQMVGSLMYLMIGSYPDIGFAVIKLAQQIENLSNEYHWAGLHHCMLWQPLVVKLIEVQAINLKGGYRYRNHKRTQQGVSAELLPIYINYRWSVLLIINPTLKSMHCP